MEKSNRKKIRISGKMGTILIRMGGNCGISCFIFDSKSNAIRIF